MGFSQEETFALTEVNGSFAGFNGRMKLGATVKSTGKIGLHGWPRMCCIKFLTPAGNVIGALDMTIA